MPSSSSSADRSLVVVTATVMEMRAVVPDHVEYVPGEHAWSFLERPWGRLVLLVTGVGPVNAGIALGRLFGALKRPAGVVNLGVAGAFCLDKLPLGTVVVAEEEIWPEYGLVTASGIDPQGIGMSLGKADGKPVWDRLRLDPETNAERIKLNISGLTKVVSLTVSGVTGTLERAADLRARYACDVENMEGFALAWACRQVGAPFVQARTVSNLVGSRDAEHWDLAGAKHRLAVAARTMFRGLHG